MERMLDGEPTERQQRVVDLASGDVAEGALKHFQKAALAVTRTRLRHLEALTRTLHQTIADITGMEPVREQQHEPAIVLDPDRLAAAFRVTIGLWLTYLAWIYTEIPAVVEFAAIAEGIDWVRWRESRF